MMKSIRALSLFVGLFVLAVTLSGAERSILSREEMINQLDQKLHYKRGEVTLPNNAAHLKLPEGFRYLDKEDTRIVLEDVWGNPNGKETLGMILPADLSPLSSNSWAVVVTFDADGHIKDADADAINYDKLLGEMKSSVAAANQARIRDGYPSLELVGWARPPHYDKSTHKLYWAKELKFDGSEANTLNYNIRVLGRRGVLNLNAVASMSALPFIDANAEQIVALAEFLPGHRYEDFNASTDKVAAYGLAALVAGGIAAKAGLFKGLIALLLAAKKFIIIGLIAVASLFKKLFSRGERTSAE